MTTVGGRRARRRRPCRAARAVLLDRATTISETEELMFRNSSKSGRQERAAARWGMGAVKLYVFVLETKG